MPGRSPPQVLVVGAGIAGLAVARALHRHGVPVEVAERTADRPPAGAGLYLPANAIRGLGALGLGPAVAERGQVINRERHLDSRGRLLYDADLGRLWRGVGPCFAIPGADLHQILRDGVSGVPLRQGSTVTAVAAEGRPRVTFAGGGTAEYDLVVGADGVNSAVRRSVFRTQSRYAGRVCWWFRSEGLPEVECVTAVLGKGRAFLVVPLGRGKVYCSADVGMHRPSEVVAGTGTGRLDLLRELFADFADPVPGILAALEERPEPYVAPVEEVTSQRWVQGRVALAGDAAHASSPSLAQGVAMAVEDALVLAELLAGARPVERALTGYLMRRAPRVRWVHEQTHRRDRIRALPTGPRDFLLRLAGQRLLATAYRPLRTMP